MGKNKGKAKPKLTRRATFVEGKHLVIDKANAPAKSLNDVKRAALNPNPPTEEGGEWGSSTVYFKPHHEADAASQYAVASTRIARFVGMPNLIARNAFGKVKKVRGLVSGEVPGGQLYSVKRDKEYPIPADTTMQEMVAIAKASQLEFRKGKYYEISEQTYQWVNFRDPRIQKGMSDLQLFDAITGQSDRHGGNIFVDPATGEVSGIDDDKSFGNGKPPAQQAEAGGKLDKYAGLPALVDEATANRILALDLSDLPKELLPRENDSVVLTEGEIEDAMRRLKGVQTFLRILKANGALVGQNGTTWDDTTYDQAMQGPATSYLKRQATDLAEAVRRSANDPEFVVKGAPPIMQPQIPPLPAVPPGMPGKRSRARERRPAPRSRRAAAPAEPSPTAGQPAAGGGQPARTPHERGGPPDVAARGNGTAVLRLGGDQSPTGRSVPSGGVPAGYAPREEAVRHDEESSAAAAGSGRVQHGRVRHHLLGGSDLIAQVLGKSGTMTVDDPDVQARILSARRRAEELMVQLTPEEKLQLVHGNGRPSRAHPDGTCGTVVGVPRLGIPDLVMADGPNGVGNGATGVTAFPSSIAVAASWNRDLMTRLGAAIGTEHVRKGHGVALTPTVNILRIPHWGRSFETLGEDPYLASALAQAQIRGVQSAGAIATVKHLAANNQENNRWDVDAVVSERALREIYLPAFEASVQAGVLSVMAAYNRINGTFAAENRHLMVEILQEEWGFLGFDDVGLGRDARRRLVRRRRPRRGDAVRSAAALPRTLRAGPGCGGGIGRGPGGAARRHGRPRPHRHERREPHLGGR